MRGQEIVGIIMEYIHLALIGVIVLGAVFWISYVLIYQRLLGGKKRITKKEWFIGGTLTGYIIMVLGVTLFMRGSSDHGNIDFYFLSSYREAWNHFTLRHWQFVILNIVMFVPLGILLPLLHRTFLKIKWTLGAGLLFTMSIESLQLVTGRGNFVVDDLFNNFLGAVIGYGMVMGLLALITIREWDKAFLYFAPLFIVLTVFGGIFICYHLQEFGNLSVAHTAKINMKNTITNVHIELKEQRTSSPIYQAPTYAKDSAERFAVDFFENVGIDTKDMVIIAYHNNANYRVESTPSYHLWLNYLDGSYDFIDFSMFDEEIEPMDEDVDRLIEKLQAFGVSIPEMATLNHKDVGEYQWTVEQYMMDNQLVDGVLSCVYYNDHSIKKIRNDLVTYVKVKDVRIKSEMEAYRELLKGKFQYSKNRIEAIEINEVKIQYYLDSKGYYQPVYLFNCTVDGVESNIIIPAI